MNDTITLAENLTRNEMIAFVAKVLIKKHGKLKGLRVAVSMVDILEAKYLQPRPGYLINLIADTKTGEVHFIVDKKFSYVNLETKVLVKNLIYSKRVLWSGYVLRSL